jgi:hypothetical protein
MPFGAVISPIALFLSAALAVVPVGWIVLLKLWHDAPYAYATQRHARGLACCSVLGVVLFILVLIRHIGAA